MDTVAFENEIKGLREDIKSLTKAVLTVAAVLAEQGRPTGNSEITRTAEGRRLVEVCHGLVGPR